jgi:hypothetical protein
MTSTGLERVAAFRPTQAAAAVLAAYRKAGRSSPR